MKKIIFGLVLLALAFSAKAQTEVVETLEKQWYVTVGDIEYQVNLSSGPFNSMELPAEFDETIPLNVAEAIWVADSMKFPVNKIIVFNALLPNEKTYNLAFIKFIFCNDCESTKPWRETEYVAYVQRIGKVTAQK